MAADPLARVLGVRCWGGARRFQAGGYWAEKTPSTFTCSVIQALISYGAAEALVHDPEDFPSCWLSGQMAGSEIGSFTL